MRLTALRCLAAIVALGAIGALAWTARDTPGPDPTAPPASQKNEQDPRARKRTREEREPQPLAARSPARNAKSLRVPIRVLAAEDGTPIPDATLFVVLGLSPAASQPAAATTAANGLAVMDAPGDTPFQLLVRAPERVRRVLWLNGSREMDSHGAGWERLDVAEDGTVGEFTVRLDLGVPITGHVTDEATGEGVAGVTVTAEDGMPSLMRWASAITADDGSFRLTGLPVGSAQLQAHGHGWTVGKGSGRAVKDQDNSDSDSDPVQLSVARAGEVEGSVTALDGSAAAGVLVYATVAADPELVTWPQRVDPHTLRTRTDSSGRFAIRHLPVGVDFNVFAVRNGDGDEGDASRIATARADEAGQRLVRDLRLETLIDAEFVLQHADGTRVSNVHLECDPVGDARRGCYRSPADDASPWTLAHTHPGRQRILLRGYKVFDQDVEFDVPGATSAPIVVICEKGKTLEGVVVDEHGAPLARVGIAAEPATSLGRNSWGKLHYEYVATDAEGRFRMGSLAAVPYVVKFLGPGKHVIATRRWTPPADTLRVVIGKK